MRDEERLALCVLRSPREQVCCVSVERDEQFAEPELDVRIGRHDQSVEDHGDE